MTRLLIFGLGNLAQLALSFLEEDGGYEPVAFVVERNYLTHIKFEGLPVYAFEDISDTHPPGEYKMIIVIGPNQINTVRERIYREALGKGYELITYVSPRAHVSPKAQLGRNCFIFDGVTIEAYTAIGNNTIIWSNATVAHHCQIGDHCFLAPAVAVSGKTTIENNCFLGINATVIDHIRVASHCIIGAGALIKKNTEPYGVYSSPGTGLRYLGAKNVHL